MNEYIFNEDCDYGILHITDKGQVYEILFDIEDYDLISSHAWRMFHNYPTEKGSLLTIHNLLIQKKNPDNVIDHINRNTLDNRKNNLREVNRSINSTNAKVRSDKTQLDLPRGVVYRPEDKTPRSDDRGQKRYESFEVQWSIEGKRKSKTFSVKKWGSYEKAREAAIAFRNDKLKEMKI